MNSNDLDTCVLALITGIFFGSMIILIIQNPSYIPVAVTLGLFFVAPWLIWMNDR